MERLSILATEEELTQPRAPSAAALLHGGLLALGTALPQTLALVGIAYAPLLAMGQMPNPLWCLWSAVLGSVIMLLLTRQRGVVYGIRPGAALLYGSTLFVCASMAQPLGLTAWGALGLTAACLMLSAAVIWLAVRTGATVFARYLPAPVGRGLSLGFGLTILWLQLKAVGGWYFGDAGYGPSVAAVAATVLLVLLTRLTLIWRRRHPALPYLLALLPLAGLCVWVLEWGMAIPFAWVSAPPLRTPADLLPPWLPLAFATEVLGTDAWALARTALTVLVAQALFVAFTFIVEAAGNGASIEQMTGEPYDLNGELRASALAMAVMPWFALMPPSGNLALTKPLYDSGLRGGTAIRWSNAVVVLGLLSAIGLAWLGLNRVPVLFVVAALVVIGWSLVDPSLLARPDDDPGERQMWWQTWVIGLVFLFTSGVFAMLAGFAVAVAQLVRGAEGSVVRSIYTLREIRSRRWRGPEEEIALRRAAGRAVVVVLQGTASFAVARRIREEISRVVNPREVDALLIDAQRVVHWDVTALESFRRMADELQRTEVELLMVHPSEDARRVLTGSARMFDDIDRALEAAENQVLRRQGLGTLIGGKPLASAADLPLLAPLAAEARRDLLRFGKVTQFAAGQQVFNVGDRDGTLMAVLAGSVSIEAQGRTHTVRVATFGPGTVFGEMAFLDGSARSARATAIDAAQVFSLARSDFLVWAQHHPRDAQRLLNQLAAQISQRLRFTTAQLIAFNP